jgi:uncharacterized protein with HEPN domain
MRRDIKLFLTDILTACEDMQNFVKGMDLSAFIQDRKTSSAVIRQFEIIGEAAKNVPDWIRQKYTKIPWKDIAGMRDRLIHGYFGVDYNLVWDTISTKVPELKDAVRRILDDLREQKDDGITT